MLKLPNGKLATGIVTLIGSRKAPDEVLDQFYVLTQWFIANRFLMRSGSADGIDWVCEDAANQSECPESFTSYIPWRSFGPPTRVRRVMPTGKISDLAMGIAKDHIPWWDKIPRSHHLLLSRNAFQVLGDELDKVSNLCVYWAPIRNGKPTGGTSYAIRYCETYKVRHFNLYDPDNFEALKQYLLTTYGLVLDLTPFSNIYHSSVRTPYKK